MAPRKSSSKKPAPRTPSSSARLSAATAAVREASGERDVPFRSLNPAVNEVVSPLAAKNLVHYKYSTIDHSIMQRVFKLHKFWDWCATLLPYWMAPNMLTLFAFVCNMSFPLLIIYYEAKGVPFPAWIWLFSAVMFFIYWTADATDGKHARRTKATGALGELFDHGCDAFASPAVIYASCRCMGFSDSQTFIMTLASGFTLFVTILEQFLTGTFVLPILNGPTEGIALSLGFYVFTFIKGGPAFWATKLATPLVWTMPKTLVQACRGNLAPSFELAATYGDVVWGIFFVLAIISAVDYSRSVWRNIGNRTDAMVSFGVHLAVVAVWALYAAVHPTSAYPASGKFCFVYGVYFAYAASHLTVLRLCQLPCKNSYGMILLAVWLPVAKLLLRDRFCAASYAVPTAVLMAIAYSHYLLSVFHQFSRTLGVGIIFLNDHQMKVSHEQHQKRVKAGQA